MKNLKEAANKIKDSMAPLKCVVSVQDGYVRIWNCYCGSIMMAYNKKLDKACAAVGMRVARVRTFGNGMTKESDWEDRAVFIED